MTSNRTPQVRREARMTPTKLLIGQILIVLAIVLAGIWLATQWAAAHLAYQPELGAPWAMIGGISIYRPWSIFLWWYHFDAYAPHVFDRAGAIAGTSGLVGCGAAVAGSLLRARQRGNVTTYGSARWASTRDAAAAGLFRDAGVFLGRLNARYLRHDGPEHVMAFAPTRSGKGVGLVVPSLLGWSGSAVVHDIKGENWQLQGRFYVVDRLFVAAELRLGLKHQDIVRISRVDEADMRARVMTEVVATAIPKVDPETLAIRARPPRAIRFRRGVIIAIAAIGSVSLIALTWMALRPRLWHRADARQELSEPNARPLGDALNGVPSSYADVPRLGPPLPGDLGRPILEHQRAMLTTTQPAGEPVRQADAAGFERRRAELKAARESGILVQGRPAATPAEPNGPTGQASAAATPNRTPRLSLDPDRDPNAQGRKAEFVDALDARGDVNPHALSQLVSPYTLSAGSVISASLITGLRSDLPGLVTAQVTENIYDSATGRILLIPQGARLIGSYDSIVAFGQARALVVWQRIVMPDGSSLRIDNVSATDPSGYAGLQDKVDLHTWRLLKGVALSTSLGISSQLALSGQSDLVQALRMSTQDTVSRAGDQITQRSLGIQPTITIRPGAPVRLVVHKDLILAPWRQEER
jgi:type IV secretory pathway VirB10-like protein